LHPYTLSYRARIVERLSGWTTHGKAFRGILIKQLTGAIAFDAGHRVLE
jgi:hypothetical protein